MPRPSGTELQVVSRTGTKSEKRLQGPSVMCFCWTWWHRPVIIALKGRGSGIQGHLWLYGQLKVSLSYMRPRFLKRLFLWTIALNTFAVFFFFSSIHSMQWNVAKTSSVDGGQGNWFMGMPCWSGFISYDWLTNAMQTHNCTSVESQRPSSWARTADLSPRKNL